MTRVLAKEENRANTIESDRQISKIRTFLKPSLVYERKITAIILH